MKILFVTPYFPPHRGGTQHYVYHIAKGLQKHYGCDSVIITTNTENKTLQREQVDHMTVYRLPFLFRFSNTPVHPWWYFTIKKIISEEKPDLINAHSPVPFMADMASQAAGNTPFVLTYHTGPMMAKEERMKDLIIALYEKYFLPFMANKAIHIICPSDYVKRTVLMRYATKTLTISPGVDTDMFTPVSSVRNDALLFVGSLHKAERYKGLDTLLQSVHILKKKRKKFVLTVVGGGDWIDEYKRRCTELEIDTHVVFAGILHGTALVRAYQHASLLVHPSHFESFSLVLLEAMACKIPVVSTTVGGIPEIVTHGKNGLLVPPKNPKALADAIDTILSDPRLSARMKSAAYTRIVQRFHWDTQVQTTYRLFEKLVYPL